MARTNNLTNFLTDVSLAIKNKIGDNTPIPASEFDTKIATIETGIDTSDATATANDIARNKTAYVDGRKVTGTLRTVNYCRRDTSEELNPSNLQIDVTRTFPVSSDVYWSFRIMSRDGTDLNKFIVDGDDGYNMVISTNAINVASAIGLRCKCN